MQRSTDDVEAYNLYLMAWQHYVNSQEKDVQRLEAIVRLCARATEKDPGYAQAWALMAIGQMILRFAHGRKDDDGLSAAERALVADPDNFSMRYNFACALALDSRTTEAAIDMLGPLFGTVDRSTLHWAKVDPDLNSLRESPRFKALVAATEARFAAENDGGQKA